MTEFDNMVPALGIETIESGDGRAVGEMEHRPDLSQATGVFRAGAIFTLADTMATAAVWSPADPDKEQERAKFPFAVQSNCHSVGNVAEGKLRAESQVVHPGPTMVVETNVHPASGKLVALITTTLIVPDAR